MSSIGIVFRRPSSAEMARDVQALATEPVTYGHLGSTLDPDHWPDREMHGETVDLGSGAERFAAAVDGLRRWVCHDGIGATVYPRRAAIAVGTTLLVVLPLGPAHIVVPNRIVGVVDDRRRFGFAYGTLPGHQEQGEEAFILDMGDAGAVTATIRVDARAATFGAKAIGPGTRIAQRVALRRYLEALRAHVERTVDG